MLVHGLMSLHCGSGGRRGGAGIAAEERVEALDCKNRIMVEVMAPGRAAAGGPRTRRTRLPAGRQRQREEPSLLATGLHRAPRKEAAGGRLKARRPQ